MRVNAGETLRHAVDDLNFDSEAFSPVSPGCTVHIHHTHRPTTTTNFILQPDHTQITLSHHKSQSQSLYAPFLCKGMTNCFHQSYETHK